MALRDNAAHRSLHDPAFAALVDCLTAALLRDDMTLRDLQWAVTLAHERVWCAGLRRLEASLHALADPDPPVAS